MLWHVGQHRLLKHVCAKADLHSAQKHGGAYRRVDAVAVYAAVRDTSCIMVLLSRPRLRYEHTRFLHIHEGGIYAEPSLQCWQAYLTNCRKVRRIFLFFYF